MFMMRMFRSVVDVGMRIGGAVHSARRGRRGNMTAIMAMMMIACVRLGLRARMVAQTVV